MHTQLHVLAGQVDALLARPAPAEGKAWSVVIMEPLV